VQKKLQQIRPRAARRTVNNAGKQDFSAEEEATEKHAVIPAVEGGGESPDLVKGSFTAARFRMTDRCHSEGAGATEESPPDKFTSPES